MNHMRFCVLQDACLSERASAREASKELAGLAADLALLARVPKSRSQRCAGHSKDAVAAEFAEPP